ncbi:phytoene desaturase family protein [Candidatus Laterigemmans baculatus]|uniref:phytoene desaturase family protein n=1 Tax=Candidatus Laterigemmans baculatus TaxID=2770505 RepID=UPI0021BC9AAB|nr:NAD(P)/FAD-dependent oxidoreductase [Candidatus Laterigemmans baculatus]
MAIIGGGIAGMATAARLQSQGLSTIVLEAHGQPGGCAGFYRRQGFSFDVGATTLVDFEPGGVGGELLRSIGMSPVAGEVLPGYVAWLPDRRVTLYRDSQLWQAERAKMLGDTPAHRQFWRRLDHIAGVFWRASRRGVRLPLRTPTDIARAVRSVGLANLPLSRYLNWTMGDALRAHGLRDDQALVGLLAMLVEDTVHSTVDEAPLINAALGITIRGSGLMRAEGGMRGFWRSFVDHYRRLGGHLRVGCPVRRVTGREGEFLVETRRGTIQARQIVSAVPVELTSRLAPGEVSRRLQPYLSRDADAGGGAVVVFLGVPEEEVDGQEFTHHQLVQQYDAPLGNGNNMFISVSAAGDTASAPGGYRAVMISTHCELARWQGLSPEEYDCLKVEIGTRLIALARRVYPRLGTAAKVCEVGTPRTYERFTHRPQGAVGGVRQMLSNSNQKAIPHELGVPGFWLAGDTTWPGLGTVACVLGSRLVAERVLHRARRWSPASRQELPSGSLGDAYA